MQATNQTLSVDLKNLGTVNKNAVYIATHGHRVTLYFSYETIVGVESHAGEFIAENKWSNTTGKLLNQLEPDKSKRYPHGRVMVEVDRALSSLIKPTALLFNEQELDAIRKVVEYAYDEEEKHWRESGQPTQPDHVFNSLALLKLKLGI